MQVGTFGKSASIFTYKPKPSVVETTYLQRPPSTYDLGMKRSPIADGLGMQMAFKHFIR
jgi:hypothetical protein